MTSLRCTLLIMITVSGWTPDARAQSQLDAIVEKNGAVVLCFAGGGITFPDQCAGTGRLRIVQPIVEGPIVWRSATGAITMQNETPSSPDCALSRASWEVGKERAAPSGKRIRLVDGATVLARFDKSYPGVSELIASDITGFALDLDNDGRDEIVFSASNVRRIADLHEQDGKNRQFSVIGGILRDRLSQPYTFFQDAGEYRGGTDTISDIHLKGVVPLSSKTGEIGLLIKSSSPLSGDQDLVRFRRGSIQRIQTIEFLCN